MMTLELSVQFHKDLLSGEWYVDRITANRGNVRSQTSFRVPMPMRHVFAPEVLDFFMPNLPVSADSSVSALERYDFSGLAVSFERIRIIAQKALGGVQAVTVRIRSAIGALAAIYLPHSDVRDVSEQGIAAAPEMLRIGRS